MTKTYDRAYFDKWYRSRFHRVITPAEVRRKATLAVSVTEYVLRRTARTVLDVGCGEGAWMPHLRSLRPRISYTGVDPSEYAVSEFGRTRNILRGGFGGLASLRLRGPFDLIICSDVMHYLDDAEIRSGMKEIVRLLRGIAWLEALTKEDAVTGDLEGLKLRPASWYRRTFSAAGLTPAGPWCWIPSSLAGEMAVLEFPQDAAVQR
ncbi:MAG TPA: class I SAM-dependent methyltransferase [Thermoanaerobaculia bacterium]|nr:class I SAM-dependent methyltransferase [Thermoanaerobaculia bacterium]